MIPNPRGTFRDTVLLARPVPFALFRQCLASSRDSFSDVPFLLQRISQFQAV